MICGIDEAGRGPVIGPLVIAGVKLQAEDKLVELNVRDSKKCTVDRRSRLAEEINDIAEIELVTIDASELDILRQAITLNEIETILFSKIIQQLKPEKAFVDCVDTNEDNFRKELLKRLDYSPELVSRHKADDIYPVVSAASIIAKTERDKEVDRISNEIGEPIGSGYPADPITVEFIKNWLSRNGEFPPYTRHSWKTTKRLWDEYKYPPTSLNDFINENDE